MPKAFGVTRTPGGVWRRLYSATSTRRVMRRTTASSYAGGDDLGRRPVVLHVGLEDRVQHVVGRQALVVTLVGPQLGRRRLGEHRLGDDLPAGRVVDVPAQPVDRGLVDVLDDGEASGRVAGKKVQSPIRVGTGTTTSWKSPSAATWTPKRE